VIERPIFF